MTLEDVAQRAIGGDRDALNQLVTGLQGEVYARTGKIPEAQASYDTAAKIYPAQASVYLTNEAVIFSQPATNNPDAQAAAADKAIAVDPAQALPYYLKGNALVGKTTFEAAPDGKSQHMVAPPGCMEAYQKYLALAPNGPYADEVKGILAGFGQKLDTSFKADKPKKK